MSFGSGNFLRFYFNSQLSQFRYASSLFPLLAPLFQPSSVTSTHSLPLTHSLFCSLPLLTLLSLCVCVVFIQCTALPTTTRAHNASNRESERASSISAHSLARLRCLHSVSLSPCHTLARLPRLACTARAMRGHPLALTNAVGRRQSSSDDDGDDARHISLCHIVPSGCGVRVWVRGRGG